MPSQRASLHAKCVVVDDGAVFVSSANFTEAAQTKNLEVGLLVHSRSIASHLVGHCRALVDASLLKAIPLTR